MAKGWWVWWRVWLALSAVLALSHIASVYSQWTTNPSPFERQASIKVAVVVQAFQMVVLFAICFSVYRVRKDFNLNKPKSSK